MSEVWVPTAAEYARLFRARAGYVAGYWGEWDDYAGEGTVHCCHLVARLPPLPARAGSVLRGLRGIGLL